MQGELEEGVARRIKDTLLGRKVPENNLRKIREGEGLSRPELSDLADVSVDTINDVENRKREVTNLTKHKLVNGLNANPNKRDKQHVYTLADVFPNG